MRIELTLQKRVLVLRIRTNLYKVFCLFLSTYSLLKRVVFFLGFTLPNMKRIRSPPSAEFSRHIVSSDGTQRRLLIPERRNKNITK